MDLHALWGIGSIPLIIAFVQVMKRFVSDGRWYPIFAVVFGVALNMLIGWRIGTDPILSLVSGFIFGLSAVGLYEGQLALRSADS